MKLNGDMYTLTFYSNGIRNFGKIVDELTGDTIYNGSYAEGINILKSLNSKTFAFRDHIPSFLLKSVRHSLENTENSIRELEEIS